MQIFHAHYTSPIGQIALSGTAETLLALNFADGDTLSSEEDAKLPLFAATQQWLDAYFAGEKPNPGDLSPAPAGTALQQTVWQLLLEIPYGLCTSYGAVAKEAAHRMHKDCISPRTAANAIKRNPLALVIPCHRVEGWNGNLVGYAGGIARKEFLLRLEGVHLEKRNRRLYAQLPDIPVFPEHGQ